MADFPYYLQGQTEEAIRRRMLDRLPADLDKSEGSFLWDTQAPAAFMLSEAASWAQELLRRGFVSTAASTDDNFRSDELDLRAAEHGVTRRGATFAEGTATFTGEPGRLVPAGTTVSSLSDDGSGEAAKEYETLAAVTLSESGKGSAPIRALLAGKAGNIPPGAITLLSDSVAGVTGVTNAAAATGGSNIESDVSLLERFYAKVRNQGTSGNKSQYMQWAGEIPGVGASRVLPLWKGPGTVAVYLLDNDKRAAGASIVSKVQDYIDPTQDGQGEGMAPAGPVVTVMPAEEVPIHIEVTPTLASGASAADVKAQIQAGVASYLKQLAFRDPLVRYTRIAAILLDIPPLIDYAQLTVNGTSERNIEIKEHQVAVPGTVTVHG
ncbi:baseplate J/gp47 family protein [Saccharibacillus brassicae]|uniref:Baseplate J/gp47 family protein n=1 Tax=Saccharibacillus brassicae TaxID=2583377 RepID=A0A4Y6UX55_SACBS|nr:baseplate J/gp47 family protein [Saccharibacillus brassicae]QDH22309.1 baseplate J/gp47 family protein [Saccharibacillus brassicae]